MKDRVHFLLESPSSCSMNRYLMNEWQNWFTKFMVFNSFFIWKSSTSFNFSGTGCTFYFSFYKIKVNFIPRSKKMRDRVHFLFESPCRKEEFVCTSVNRNR